MIRQLRYRFTVLMFFCLLAGSLHGQTRLEFGHTRGEEWHLNIVVDEEVTIDGVRQSTAGIRTKVVVDVLDGEGGAGRLRNRYEISEQDGDTGIYRWSDEYETVYRRGIDGRLTELDSQSPVPTVRNVPVFPDHPVMPGDEWTASGTEVFNLGPTYGIPVLLAVDFDARYTYIGTVDVGDRKLEQILIEYGYRWNPDPGNPADRRLMTGDWFPEGITGDFSEILLWDPLARREYSAAGMFTYTFNMSDGSDFTFRGTSEGRAVYPEPLDRSALVRELEELTDDNLTARETEEGVSVDLEDLHFVPDRADLLPGEDERLSAIAGVLAGYPDRDILIVGHTAAIPGAGDGQMLSEQRARTVASYLIAAGVGSDSRIVIRGMGNREPIADNTTEEGRRRNRRVEIIILEN